MARTKAAVAEAETDEDFADLDEAVEEAEEAPKKRTRKAKAAKEERPGMTTKEAAALLDITPVKLRRILRTDDFFNDKGYTSYRLSDEDVERLRAAIAAGATEKKTRTRKSKKAEVQEAAAQVLDELDELDDLAEEDEDLELDEEDEEE